MGACRLFLLARVVSRFSTWDGVLGLSRGQDRRCCVIIVRGRSEKIRRPSMAALLDPACTCVDRHLCVLFVALWAKKLGRRSPRPHVGMLRSGITCHSPSHSAPQVNPSASSCMCIIYWMQHSYSAPFEGASVAGVVSEFWGIFLGTSLIF